MEIQPILGEKLTYEQIKSDPENENFLVTDVKFSSDGNFTSVTKKFSFSGSLFICS